MTEKDKIKLIALGEQLSTVGTKFRIAQIGLEKMIEEYGMSSPQAVEASQQCSDLALQFSNLEDEFLAVKTRILYL